MNQWVYAIATTYSDEYDRNVELVITVILLPAKFKCFNREYVFWLLSPIAKSTLNAALILSIFGEASRICAGYMRKFKQNFSENIAVCTHLYTRVDRKWPKKNARHKNIQKMKSFIRTTLAYIGTHALSECSLSLRLQFWLPHSVSISLSDYDSYRVQRYACTMIKFHHQTQRVHCAKCSMFAINVLIQTIL